MSKTQQNIITVIFVLINIGIVIFWINFLVGLKKTVSPIVVEKPVPEVEEIPEELKPGEIGEITVKEEETSEEVPLITPTLPIVIFGTSGVILEVKNDRLIVQGRGFNFADQKPRELTVIFDDSTITFGKDQKTQYQGLTGLNYLKEGIQILIESKENIRGKTEFTASIVNIL